MVTVTVAVTVAETARTRGRRLEAENQILKKKSKTDASATSSTHSEAPRRPAVDAPMTASVACSSGHAARVVARVVSRRPPSPNPLAPTLLAVEPVGDADAEERLLGNIRRHVRGFDREDDARALLREYLRFMTI